MPAPEVLAALLAAAAAAAVAFVLLAPLFSGESKEEQRKRNLTETRASRAAAKLVNETNATRRKAVSDSLKDIENRNKASKKQSLKTRLECAGIKSSTRVFYLWSALCGVVLAALSFFALPPSPLTLVLLPLSAFVGFFGLPRLWLNRKIKKRQFKFTAELAGAVDLIVRGIKAGLPLGECLQIIARESPEPIKGEFKEMVDQIRVGMTMGDALERLSQRVPTPDVRFFAIVITIQQQAGGNLSEALGNLANVLRDRAKLAMKVKAMSSEAKAGATVLGSMPPAVTLMISFFSPAYLKPLFESTMGNFILAMALVWMLMGVLAMKKMINFKY